MILKSSSGKLENKLDNWAIDNAHIILPICAIILICLIIALVLSLVTIAGFSAVESGLWYNHLKDVI